MKRIIKAFFYSIDGIKAAFSSERAFREEVFLAAILIPIAFVMNITSTDKALMVSSVILILLMELVNTAIEAVVDRISEEKHDLSKIAKDVGSAIVLVAFINAGFIWGIILL